MTLSELNEDPLRVFAVESVACLDRGGEEPALLSHGAFLGDQQVAFVGVEEENSSNRKKNEENIEGEQSERDARGMA